MAADLVRRRVELIVGYTAAALAAKLATTNPNCLHYTGDPVGLGLVASLNQPGRNVTRVTNLNVEVGPKRLELLHEAVLNGDNYCLLCILNPFSRNVEKLSRDLTIAGRTLGLRFTSYPTLSRIHLTVSCTTWSPNGPTNS